MPNETNSIYLYIMHNEDWYLNNKFKYGYTERVYERPLDSSEQHSYQSKYIKLFKINETEDYLIATIQRYDEIIATICRDKNLVIQLENQYNLDLTMLKDIKDFLINNDGGTEFIKEEGLELLIDIFNNIYPKLGLQTEMLSDLEVDEINNNLKRKNKIEPFLLEFKLKPNKPQQDVLTNIVSYYDNNDMGKILWACGLGKTLLSIFIIKKLDFKSVVIGVPTIYLQNQMKKEILKIFPKEENILCIGGNEMCTTNSRLINKFINKRISECKFIITTYHSCHLLTDNFDFKIADEAHHLAGLESESERTFKRFHEIQSKKTLFMTGTEKVLESRTEKTIFSMDDERLFGKVIDNKTVKWAIENGYITDYNIMLTKATEAQIDHIIEKMDVTIENKELFISAYMTLKSIETSDDLTHVLIYTNKTDNSDQVKIYIDILLNSVLLDLDINDFYNESLHSKSTNDENKLIDFKEQVDNFKDSKYGIISCVYIFGEGFDLPKLNGVTFADNMESDIRIVQCSLRPNRKEKGNPNKIATILIPYIESRDDEKESFEKCRMIISKLRIADESIAQKIKINSLNKKKRKKKLKKSKEYDYDINEENIDELNKIKQRLIWSKALTHNFKEEEDEYNYVKSINKTFKLTAKDDYFNNCDKTNHELFIKEPEKYFRKKGVWTHWYDFLSIDTSNFLQTKDEWKIFCKSINIKTIEQYNEECDKNNNLPKEPELFYNGYTNFNYELDLFTNRRR